MPANAVTARMLAAIAALVSMSASTVGAQTAYTRATIDSAEELRITTTTGRTILPAKDTGQVGFGAPAISADHRRVGWLALYPNCCTSYPIPLRLVVRTADQERVFDGAGLPVWRWLFMDSGRRVAFRQAPVHGGAPAHYELRDVDSGTLVDSYDEPAKPVPRWVHAVDRATPPI